MIGPRGIQLGPRIGARIGLGGDSAPSGTTLQITNLDALDPILGAKPLVNTIQVTNVGGVAATSLTVTITLDASLTFVSAIGAGWSISRIGQVITATLASLAVGPAVPIVVTTITANVTASITTTAQVVAANASTVSVNQSTQVNAVTLDAALGWRLPSSAAEWTALMAAAALATGIASSTHLCQEPSGSLADSIGNVALAPSGAGHLYQQAVAGVSRLAVKTVDGTAGQKWINSTTAPNPNTESTLWLLGVAFPAAAPAANRDLVANSASMDVRFNATGKLAIINGATTAGAQNVPNTIQLIAVQHDLTNGVWALYSLQEKIAGTFAAVASNPMFVLGGQTAAASDAATFYIALFRGAAAELAQAQMRALFQTLTADAVVPVVIPW